MIKTLITLALALAAAPAAVAAPLLWGKVEIDMPFESARAAYPDAEVSTGKGLFRPMLSFDQVVDDCQVSVMITIDRKVAEPGAKVDFVQLSGEKCDAKMFTQLLAKYGEPLTLNNDNRDKKKTARWNADGRSIVYKREAGEGFSPDRWEITYAAVKELGL
ncbi:hypothetical protein [Sphingomonas sp. SRS2]|uniref:hypothetical protein n=1 Tax=Sphingomonas sp. SRS2 TaxID=133190 RepID=UPI00061849A1|nr:hypothetical protein [Sphingomonas sp. SRS2]KKC27428.1 hypothetical protein WP12_03370 [Sphingomonas sp. SRS2]